LKATLRSLELLQDAELSVSVLDLPGGVDPDELVKTQGIEGWRAQIEEAQSIGGFLFSTTVAQHDLETAEGRRRAIIELKEAFPLLPNVESKDRFIKQAAERFGLTDELVRQSFLRHRESDRMVYEVQSQEVNEKVSPTVMKERYLLAHFLNDLEVFRRTRREFEDGDFTDSTCRRVLELLAKLENAAGSPAETLISLTDDEEIQRFVARESMSHPLPEENQEEDVRQCLQALRRDNLDRELRRLRTKIRDEPNADLKVAMQKEANVLRRRLVQSRSENSWR